MFLRLHLTITKYFYFIVSIVDSTLCVGQTIVKHENSIVGLLKKTDSNATVDLAMTINATVADLKGKLKDGLKSSEMAPKLSFQ